MSPESKKKRLILAITGASGTVFALEFLQVMQDVDVEVHGIISDAGRQVMKLELGQGSEQITNVTAWHDVHDFTAPMASGSARFDAMVVLPCTMGTLAAIANGEYRTLPTFPGLLR